MFVIMQSITNSRTLLRSCKMSIFIKCILHKKLDTRARKGINNWCHSLEHASVNSKTPENMARLTANERERERERAIGKMQLGASYAHVARILSYTKLAIIRLIQRYRVNGRTADIPRSGRTRITTANEDHHLSILHLRNIFLNVTSSVAIGLGHVISRHTVRRRLQQHGIRAY